MQKKKFLFLPVFRRYIKTTRHAALINSLNIPFHNDFRTWAESQFLLRWFLVSRAVTMELKQPRRRRQQEPHKFAYLTMKNSIFARFPRAFFIFWHFVDVLVLSTTWNDLFRSCVDDVSIWWQMFNFVLCPKRWFQFNSRILRTHFSSIMTLNNWKMIWETQSYIFRWRSRFCRRRACLSSLMTICRRSLYHENKESRRNLRQKFLIQIGTRNPSLNQWTLLNRLIYLYVQITTLTLLA